MKISYEEIDGRLEVQISGESDWNLFDKIAQLLLEKFGGRWTEKLDGLDQRYWDLVIDNTKVILHLENYLGISLFPAEDHERLEQGNRLVQAMGRFLESIDT